MTSARKPIATVSGPAGPAPHPARRHLVGMRSNMAWQPPINTIRYCSSNRNSWRAHSAEMMTVRCCSSGLCWSQNMISSSAEYMPTA